MALGVSSVALGVNTNLSGTVGTSGGGTFQQDYPDNPNASLSSLVSEDAVGNDAAGYGTMAALAGYFRLSTHGCSGGQMGWGGQSNAQTHADVTLDFRVESATLPAGTPVQLQVRWAVNGSETAAGSFTYHGYGASGQLDAAVGITVGGVAIISKSGSRYRQYNITNGYTHSIFGALNVEDDHGDYTVTALVGQQLRFFLSATSYGTSIAGNTDVADGDSQIAMSWGVSSLNPQATVVSLTHPGQPVPPADNATPEQNEARVPPRPAYLPVCFTFTEQPIAESECISGNAGFAVSTSGTGPFTYQWRRNGVPLDTIANPSAATASLMLPSVSAGDAGLYKCVVTNACGSRTSDAVPLTVTSTPTIPTQPVAATACGSGTGSFSVAAGPGADPVSYQWQIESSPGIWHDLHTDGGEALPCGGSASISQENAPSVALSVTPCPAVTHYQVRCIVSNACGSVTSNEATYTICPADFDCNGQIQPADIATFVNTWFADLQNGTPPPAPGDFDHNGLIEPADIAIFVNAWFAALTNGC